nr:alpha-amylase family glycosyl hydrolase [uncultured Mediterraneibacter sp.]
MKRITGKPQPFGAVVEGSKANFAVQVPSGKTCEVLLYRVGKARPEHSFEMPEEEGIGEVRFLGIDGIEAGKYEYNYRIDGKVYVDPYVREIAGKKVFGKRYDEKEHQIRGRLVSADYDWGDDKRLHLAWKDVVAYSLHIRGFTKHSSSRVPHKGTFRGVIEKLPYLKELGINQIQCMPVYEFDECARSKINYWGYGPAYYFAPKESYASGDSAVCELKEMVMACHREGVEVVLEMPFTEGVAAQTALECLRFYMLEYHIDGFVVNPYVVPWDMLKNDPFLKDIKLMCRDDGFQNVMRRFLKGDENMVNDVIQALKHNSSQDGKCNYMTTHTGFTLWDLVSYDGKHNEANGEHNTDGPDYNYSWNCGAEGPSRKKAVVTLRKNQVRNAMMLLLLAQGTPCLLAGDEFYNSQKGNNNVYCQDNETGWVDWSKLKTDDSLFRFVKELIAFRKDHPCLHREDELQGLDRTGCGMPDVSYHGENAWQVKAEVSSRQLGVLYSGAGVGGSDCFIAYNMHWLPHEYALPSPGKNKVWCRSADTEKGISDPPVFLEDQKRTDVMPRSISILVSAQAGEKKKGRARRRPEKKDGGQEKS